MLDDDAGRFGKAAHAFPCRVGVGDIVERQLLALHLLEGGERARRRIQIAVERCLLVRVFAVAQIHQLHEAAVDLTWESIVSRDRLLRVVELQRRQIVADRAVVVGDVVERGHRQLESRRAREAAVRFDFGQRLGILIGRGEHADVVPVFRRGAQHRRAADVDVFDRLLQRAVGLCHRALERIQVQHQQIDRRNAQLGHQRVICAAATEQAAVDLRMQGLDATVHDFREAGHVAHVAHRDTGVAQRFGAAAGREQLNAGGDEPLAQLDQAGLVRHAEQSAANGSESWS